jgi:hypothetical protein
MATTVVRPDTFVVAVAALVPWVSVHAAPRRASWLPDTTVVNASVAALVAIAAVAAAVATGGLARSSLTIANLRPEPVIVRFSAPFQGATFGYQLEAGAAGVAWSDEMGTVTAPVFIMARDCRLLFRFEPHPETTTLVVGADGVDHGNDDASPVGLPFLAYVPDCAAEARAELARAP